MRCCLREIVIISRFLLAKKKDQQQNTCNRKGAILATVVNPSGVAPFSSIRYAQKPGTS
ncbi:hypothetical protein [Methanoregula sp.]|uniref:hypothetical protein n=1 Tax=Methanoregula sp. TaxID=2052170 RepID=UPI0025D115E4|nr:hypothetical protein [Methanoregula sp.]